MGGSVHMSIFRYERRIDQPKIALLNTWHATLGVEVQAPWVLAARAHTRGQEHARELQVETTYIDWKDIGTRMTVIQHLILKDQLLNKTSMQQMLIEEGDQV